MKRKYFLIVGFMLLVIVPATWWWLMVRQTPSVDSPAAALGKPAITLPKNPHLEHLFAEYSQRIDTLMMTSGTPGAALAVVKDSSIVYLRAMGLRSSDMIDSVNTNTVFRIASVSKCFASFLTGILVEDSLLSWDTPVVRYLPGFSLKSAEQTQRLTLRHVLSHTVGLPYHTYTNLVEEGDDLPDMLTRLKDVNMASDVGTQYSYQNVAYSLIGEVIQAATGKPYNSWMKERVFTPLNMQHASITYAELMADGNIARPHKLNHGKWVPARITNTYYNVAPAGGVNASITDMAKWMIALLGNREQVISRKTLATLFSPAIKAPSKNRNYGRMHKLSDSYYGLGWRVLYYPDDTLIYHGGFVNGYRSEVAVNVRDRIAICILANAPGELADNGIPLFFSLFKMQRDSILRWDERQRKLLLDSLNR